MKTSKKKSENTIRKLARIRDKATVPETYLEVIEFPVSDSERGRLELPPSIVNETYAFEKRLRDAGAILPHDGVKELLQDIAKSEAPKQMVYEAHTGWLPGRSGFVLVDDFIGESEQEIIGVNRANSANDPSGRLTKSGTWETWRSTVGEHARLSSLLMCSVCSAFAAPLLGVLGRESFTLCVSGPSRKGKSIATIMGASVVGIGKTTDLITWNITDARLEQRLAGYNDCLFPIDDLSVMKGGGREKYLHIRDNAYKLAQGWSTARHDSYTQAHGGGHEQWRCLVLTSSEVSVRELARTTRQERQRGEAVRLIDLPALEEGADHIFDRAPANEISTDFEGWKINKFAEIADACEKNCGQAYEKYIKFLIAMGSELAPFVQCEVDFFLKHVCDEYDGDLARDVARKFGLLYAGGMLARRCKLLNWDKKELLDAITKCFGNARDLLPDDGVLLRAGIKALKTKLAALPSLSQLATGKASKDQFARLEGYKTRGLWPKYYLIKRDAFNAIFASRTQRNLAVNWLIKMGGITLALQKTSPGAPANVPKAQFPWPDGERRRSYEIIWSPKMNEKASE